jgi:hypothetical protein
MIFRKRFSEIPITASTMPIRVPSSVEAVARISVFFSPTVIMIGSTATMDCQSRKLRLRLSNQSIADPPLS